MIKILVTGINSYIGDSFTVWMNQWPDKYEITQWDFRGDGWETRDMSEFDVVYNVAGIAHNSNDKKLEEIYYQVNRDLAIKIAEKARKDGVKQFIHMSSIIVYGSKVECITKDTKFNPDNFYGDSKLQGELGVSALADKKFKVTIIRSPMIYGPNSKGNFPLLKKYAMRMPVFPKIENKRSMLYIDNLCEFIRLVIDRKITGVLWPQNKDYVCTSEFIKEIANQSGKTIKLTTIFNPIIRFFSGKIKLINKVFGNLVYDKDVSQIGCEYNVCDFKTSIKISIRNDI
ncbi:MAG: NAD-dependent epimerase/dehydratase family protein [Clostridiaceae bacterium]|nr:NAD-dependent epimerase/dehydratase family protein [Clostridiaceae bacterium]